MNKNIWLVDATVYRKDIDEELRRIKEDYFKIKSYVRNNKIGRHVLPTQRTFSMGLLRIATILKRNGYTLRYIHLENFMKMNLTDEADNMPDIVAFSCVCSTVPICNQFAKKIKSIDKAVTTIIGGAHINVALNKTKELYQWFDRYVKGYDIDAVKQIVESDSIVDIEGLPYADYSILPHQLNEYDINIFTTLGCPFKCFYCQDGQMPYFEYLMDGGLDRIKDKLVPNKLVHFFDSTFGYSEQRLLEICSVLEQMNHRLILSCDIRAEFISEVTIAALKRAGFREIRIGLETADNSVLNMNDREVLPEVIKEKVDLIKKCSSLYLTLYTVSGLPGSTKETFEKNNEMFRFLLETGTVDEIKNAQYVPYPRDDTEYMEKGVIVEDDHWDNYDRQSYPVYRLASLSRQQIWDEFLNTESVINEAWLKGCGYGSINELQDVEIYPEYIVRSYIERDGKKS